MKERIAIIDGVRSPFCKAGGSLKNMQADDLGAHLVTELLARCEWRGDHVDELIFGNVAQPAHAANIARVVALKAGLPNGTIAHTVHRNCASGMQSISSAAESLQLGNADVIVAGGTESMSNIPLLYGPEMTGLFESMFRAKSPLARLKALSRFRMRYLKPVIGVVQGLTDPVCGLNMGMTAEVVAREFGIPREAQDAFALRSHELAFAATRDGRLAGEIHPIPTGPGYRAIRETDEGPREEQSLKALARLRPYFDRRNGTVTVGNACPITDGAAAVLLMTESAARERGLSPLGFLKDWAYGGLEPDRMGLGPVYATERLLDKTGMDMSDFELIELNEAFAAQVLACEKAFGSDAFAKKHLNRDKALGTLDMDRLNVNGGAIALGHPVGVTGTRLVITLLSEMKRRNLNCGLATLCIGGGQGASFALEMS